MLKTSHNDSASFDRLFTLVYNDFRGIAKSYLACEAHADTLQATALVNEAYLRLAEQVQVDWKNRSHLLAVGAIAMRSILVNHASDVTIRGNHMAYVHWRSNTLFGSSPCVGLGTGER